MSAELLAIVVLATVASVVVALFLVLWREQVSARQSLVAIASGIVLAVWAVTVAVLARRGIA